VTTALPLASVKLRFFDRHVRAVPTHDASGCAFSGPGVDLRGEDADRAFAAAAPVATWLVAREPGITLRTLSIDLKTLRVLVTLVPEPGSSARPRVLRFDPPSANELVDAARDLLRVVGEACAPVLARRL
jgi:hypothetical protein